MGFLDDVSKAIIFDCRREHIERQLGHLHLRQGVAFEAETVDLKEMHECCDRCGRSTLSSKMFFDGKRYLCGDCKGSISIGIPTS